MAISPNSRFGRYEIRSQLGAGGMGEVYLARDPKINRDVAIKVLPIAFSSDAERLRRFEQEVEATGKLNHPNIVAVYDVETHDGIPYVVYELLEGESLRERLSGAALSTRTAVAYSLQIAHGLAAAHEKGIIHRDLKPDNIFITNDDRVKILDFGLAKLTSSPLITESQTEIPTRIVNTDPGAVMGTVGYMSPEQVKAQRLDHRSDIFSLGVILYEMLSGKRAFRGDSAVETLNAILKEDPPEPSESNHQINPALDRVVMHCLEKRPEQRFQSARDVAFALEALTGVSSSRTMTASLPLTATPSKNREKLAWIAASVFLLGLIASLPFAIGYLRRAPAEQPVATRFFIYPPDKASFSGPFAISPDGRHVVLRGTSDGKTLLWVRPLNSLTSQPLAGTEDAIYPFWSPDSRYIGFFSAGKLKKIEVTGGPVQTLCDVADGRGGTWNRDGVIVFSPNFSGGLYRVSAAGGASVPLTTLDASRKETSHVHPHFLPDGRHFLYLARSGGSGNTGIVVSSLDSNETKRLVNSSAQAAYVPPGYLVFLLERMLMAQGFDADKLELKGEPFPVAEDVDRIPGVTFGIFSVSQTGVLGYRTGSAANTQLTWFDRSGKQLGTVGTLAAYANPALSPDERRIAVNILEMQGGPRGGDIWLIELGLPGTTTRFTFDPAQDLNPTWSPDGSRIVFDSTRDGIRNFYQKAASGAGDDEALYKSDNSKTSTDWSADGKFILYQELNLKTNWDLWILPLSGEQKPFPFLITDFTEVQGRFSPDGKWIAYTSNESGAWQVYVRSFPDLGGKWQVSVNGGIQPQWRNNMKELFYISPDRKLMAVEVKVNGSTFERGVPKALFEGRLPLLAGLASPRNHYVVTRDGERFLVTSMLEELTATPTIMVLNWTADLKR